MKRMFLVLTLANGLAYACNVQMETGMGQPAADSTSGDGPEFTDDFPVVHNLNGPWEDSGREALIMQTGSQVTALYKNPFVCDHADGTGQTSETDLDFNATLAGDTLTGETSVCFHGFSDPSKNGIRIANFTATVNADDTQIDGTWYNESTDSDVPFSATRLGCLEKTADDFGLPQGNYVTSEYNANRVYRFDGSVQTVPDDYVLNPTTDNFVRQHRGVDYSSLDADGNVANVDFTAGFNGTVDVLEDSDWNTINVTLANGNVVQYLHASHINVSDGQAVTPGTVLGQTGNAGLGANGAIHLHVQAKDSSGNYINPKCAD